MAVRGDNSLHFSSGIDNSGLKSGVNEAVGLVGNLASTISSINPFAALAIGAAGAFTAIANEGYQMVKAFESAMAEVKTIAGLPEGEFKVLSSQVFDLYKQLGTEPPEALARGLYDIIGSGYEASEALQLLEISSKAATAGVTSTSVAADGLTTILNSFRLEVSDAAEIADVMFATVDRGKISFEELSTQIAQVAPLAASSGFSFQEVAGAIATLTKQGTPGAQAMTQIRAAIQSANEVLGDGVAKSLTFQNAMQALYDKAGGSQNELKNLVGRIEAVNGVLAIAGPNIKGATEDLEAMSNAAGLVDKGVKTITDTTTNQWDIFGERIKAQSESIGNTVLQMSNLIASSLNDIIEPTESVAESVRREANEFNELKNAVESSNNSFEDKIEALKEIQKQYPEYLRSLDIDKINNDNLEVSLLRVRDALALINDEQQRRIKLSGAGDRVNQSETTLAQLQSNLEAESTKFYSLIEDLKDFAAKENIELDVDFSKDPSELAGELFFELSDISLFSEGQGIINQLSEVAGYIDDYKNRVKEANVEVNKNEENLQRVKRATYDNLEGYKQIAKEVKGITDFKNLEPYLLFEYPDIKEAVKARQTIIAQLSTIKAATQIETIEPFLKSEIKEIQDFAEKRKRFLNTEYTATGSSQLDEDAKTYADYLRDQEEKYKAYTAAVGLLGEERANSESQRLLQEGKDYGEFLQKQLDKAVSFAKQTDIAVAAERSGIKMNRPDAVELTELNGITVPVDFEIDTTSLDAIEREISSISKERAKAQTDQERIEINKRLSDKEKERDRILALFEEQSEGYEELTRTIQGLSFKELQNRVKNLKQALRKELALEKQNVDAIIELQGKIKESEQEIGSRIQSAAQNIAATLSSLGSIFAKFGDESTSKLLGQLSEVADAAGQLAAGIASGDPFAIVAGAVNLVDKSITVDVISDTAKFEAVIDDLNKAVDRLDYTISKASGQDRIGSRRDQIDELARLEEQANKAAEAEKEAEKQVKLLGITVGKKGKGSGTDQAKLDELATQADEARRKVAELKEELNQLYTGTNAQSITDSIVEGFRNGKYAVEDFADDVTRLIQNALLQAFQIQYLEKEVGNFYDKFAAAGADGKYTDQEISDLSDLYSTIITGAQDNMDTINDILESSGLGTLGADPTKAQGLTGAIKGITEDQANIGAGYLNAIRLDIRQQLTVLTTSATILTQIEGNTRYNRYLESIDGRFSSIESMILEYQAQG